MTIPETIARLDELERELEEFRAKVRLLRHDLFETLDQDPDALVD